MPSAAWRPSPRGPTGWRGADLVVDNGAGLGHLDAECRRAWEIILGWVSLPGGSVAP